MQANRPMSWHPGSERLQTSFPPMPTHDSTLGSTIVGLENLAVTGTPQPSVEQSIQDAFSMACGFPLSQTPTGYVQPSTFPPNHPSGATMSRHPYQSFPPQYTPYDDSVPVGYPIPTPEPNYDVYNLISDYGLPPQPQSQPPFDYSSPMEQYQIPPEVQWQEPTGFTQNTFINPTSQLQRKKSKELVGLGLYDDKQDDFLSTLNSEPNRESLGKDLKLEETWQPPKDEEQDAAAEEEEEEEEATYSSDEAEEEAPEAPSFITPASADPPPMFYPAYGDMSNQSFFFNEDEQQLTGHDDAPYVNYLAFGPEGGQPKAQPVAGTGNFAWL